MNIDEEKRAARQLVRAKMAQFSDDYLAQSDAEIEKNLINSEMFSQATEIFAYFSVEKEIATAKIIAKALEQGKKAALPVTLGGGKMFFRYVSGSDCLRDGKYGIMEPDESCEQARPGAKSLIIVPALAFSRDFQRLGHGGGYYDRFLAGNEGVTVGLCRETLLLDTLPADSYDMPVAFIATESGIIKRGLPKKPSCR